MKVDVPELTRCCCCFPLRLGIIVIGYMKVCMAAFFFSISILICIAMAHQTLPVSLSGRVFWQIFGMSIIIIVLICEMAFGIVFLVGGHRKNYKLMRIYYIHSIVVLIIYAVWFTVLTLLIIVVRSHYVYYLASENLAYLVNYLVSEFAAGVFTSALQTYFILLIRSEIVKLRNSTQFRFQNNMIEAQSELNNLENEENMVNKLVSDQTQENGVQNADNLNSLEFRHQIYVSIDTDRDAPDNTQS